MKAKRQIFKIMVVMFIIPMILGLSVANAGVRGEFDGGSWNSKNGSMSVRMLLLPTDGNVYKVTGVNFHIAVYDDNTNKEIVNDDVVLDNMNIQIQWSALNPEPEYIEIPLRYPTLKNYSKISAIVKNISVKYIQKSHW